MPSSRASGGVVLLLALWATPTGAAPNPRPHVRAESTYIRVVLAEGVQYSPTFSTLVERIDASNVIVHVECARLNSLALQGRTLFVAATREVRYVRVQINCPLATRELTAIVGHELQHAAEIAAAPEVVDERSFGRLLQRIGFSKCWCAEEQYETTAAIDAGARVGDEMLVHHVLSVARAPSQ